MNEVMKRKDKTEQTMAKAKATRKGIPGTESNWESGKLGMNIGTMKEAEDELESALDDALSLKPISIRLQERLIEQLKVIAAFHGVGYQPLIRDVLQRFAGHEIKHLLEQIQNEKALREELDDEDSPAHRIIAECA